MKIDGLQKALDSFKADAGELRDKIRNMESRAACQDQYIFSLEKRFVNLCDGCKTRGDDTAFTPTEAHSLSRILELLERQERRQTGTLSGSPGAAQCTCQPVAGTSSGDGGSAAL